MLVLHLGFASAATWTVGSGGDFPTLSAAVAAAESGDRLELSSGTFSASVSLGMDLTIAGVGEDTILDGTGLSSRPLTVTGANLTLEDLTVSGGDSVNGGAVWISGGTLTATDTVFRDNTATTGGAIYATGSTIVLIDVTLTENTATDGGALALLDSDLEATDGSWADNDAYEDGGAVWAERTTLDVDRTSITGNQTAAGYGGAIWLDDSSAASFTDAELSDNVAYRYGGAIYAINLYGTVTFDGCTLARNVATYGHGGAVYLYNRSDVVIHDTTFEDNSAYYAGGGFYQYYLSSATVTDSVFDGNESTTYPGGGVYALIYSNELDVTSFVRTTFVNNSADDEGGGLFVYYAYLFEMADCELEGNRAGSESAGGGLYLEYGYGVEISRTRFVANEARYGGGAYLDKAAGAEPWTVANSVFQENVAEVGGGMCIVENENDDVVDLVNNAWVGNRASREASALCISAARPTVRNSVFAYHPEGAAVVIYDEESAAATSFHHSVFWENTDGDLSGKVPTSGDGMLQVAPDFVAYTRDGDPDNDSFVLVATSALIDAGDPELSDPDGSVSDIGPMGGPGASDADVDGDGAWAWRDCDDDDASIYPGADDTWYDGIDSDCGGDSDYDADGDGADAAEHGGEDCDDSDASSTACSDTASPEEPADTDDAAPPRSDEDLAEEGCGCGGGTGGIWLLALAAMLRRRQAP